MNWTNLFGVLLIPTIFLTVAGCLSHPISQEKRDQVQTAQDGLTSETGFQRIQRMRNVEAQNRPH